MVLLVPAALNLVAKSAYPLPSRIELVQAMRRGDAIALRQSSEQNEARASDLASRSGEDAQVDTLREFYKSVIPVEARAEAVSAPIFRRFNAQMAAQQSLAARLKYRSPAILGQMAMSELADNSSATYTQFNAQVAAYHQRYRDYFLPLVMQSRSLTRADVAGLPRFEYSSPREADVFGRVLGDFLWLLLFAGAVLLAGFARLRRYPAAGR